MLEEIATVVAVRHGQLWVETESRSACSHCASTSSCTTSVISKLFGVKRNRLQLDNSLGARIGDQVVVGIPDDLLVQASFQAYLLPLLVMLSTAAAGDAMGLNEGLLSLLVLGGLATGFYLVRWFTHIKQSRQRFKPQLLRIVGQAQCRVEMPNFMRS